MFIVTGATGQLGSQIVDRLLQRVPAEQVGVSVRDPAKAAHLPVRARRGDFTDPGSLAHAFEGATTVLVISASIRGEGAIQANLAAIDAAVAAGATRILYTSHQAASRESRFGPQHTHAATQDHLQRLGVPFVALRNGFYRNTLDRFDAEARTTGRLVAPEDGPFSWTAHEDLAEAAAIALTDPDALTGITPPLTATETLDLAAVAERWGVERVTVDDDAWTAAAVDRGLPPELARFTLGMFEAARAGEFDVTDPTLSRLLGRAPLTVSRNGEAQPSTQA
jgi:NAD(P)H dehydrogenase (quinone)